MEVFYCKECRSRVSSFDLDSGKGREINGNVYCSRCVKTAVVPEPEAKAVKKAVSSLAPRKKSKKSSTKIKAVRIPAGGISAPPVKKGNPALIIVIVMLLIGLGGGAVFFLTKKKAEPVKKADSTGTVYKLDSDQPDTVNGGSDTKPESSETAEKPITDTPGRETADRPEKPADEPDIPAVTEAQIPEAPKEMKFVSGEGWTDLLEDWNGNWEKVYGDWAYDGILCGLTDSGMGFQMIKTKEENYIAYKFGAVFTVDKPADVEFGFHRVDARGGRLKVITPVPGVWHTVEWTVARSKVLKILVDGEEITSSSSRVTLFTGNMSSTGAIEIKAVPKGVESCCLAVAEAGMKETPDALFNGPHADPYILENGLLEFEAEEYAWSDKRNDSVEFYLSTSYKEFSGKGYIATKLGSQNTNWNSGCEVGYRLECIDSGEYYIWLKRCIGPDKDNSVYIGMDGRAVSSREVDNQRYVVNEWHWYVHETPLKISEGSHNLLVRKREGGYRIDKIILSKNPDFLPTDPEKWTFGINLMKDGTLSRLRDWIKWKNDKGITAFKSKFFNHNAGKVVPGTHWGYGTNGVYKPGTLYRLRVWGKADNGAIGFVGIALKDKNDNILRQRIRFSSSDWEQRNMVFRTPEVKTWSSSFLFVDNEGTGGFSVTKIRLEKLPGNNLPETPPEKLKQSSEGRIFQEVKGLIIIETEKFSSAEESDSHKWEVYDDEDASGIKAVRAVPNTGAAVRAEDVASSPGMDFRVKFETAGTWIVWLRGYGKESRDDSCHVGIDGKVQETSRDADLPRGRFGWYSKRANDPARVTLSVPEPGEHVLNIWMREDGAVLDRIILTQNKDFDPESVPLKEGPPLLSFKRGFKEDDFTLNGNAKLINSRIRLTEKENNQKSSAFYKERVEVTSFETSFTFRIKEADADGFMFVLQNKGPDALGDLGGGLGIKGVEPAFGAGFRFWKEQYLYIYENGKFTKRIDLKGIDLKSGDLFRLDLKYDGRTLDILLVNVGKKLVFPYSCEVNIPAAVRAREAFAGFTGATGGETSLQEIITWEYDEK